MKVRMLTLTANPNGVIERGAVIDLPAEDAKAFASLGFAEIIESEVNPVDKVQRNDEVPRKRTNRTVGSGKSRKGTS